MTRAVVEYKALHLHDLSPALLFYMVLGFWLPLDWILHSALLSGVTPLGKCYAIASSVVFNYGVAALVLAAGVYLVAGCLRVFGASFNRVVHLGIGLLSWLVVALVCANLLRHLLFFIPKAQFLTPRLLAGVFLVAGLYAALRGYDLRRVQQVPQGLTWVLIPAALLLTAGAGLGLGIHDPIRPGNSVAPLPDILLITVDALSARNLTMYGSSRPTSPNLQAFASGATTFDKFYANSNWTRPGIASLLNGSRPWTHGGDVAVPRPEVVRSLNVIRQLALAGYQVSQVDQRGFVGPAAQNLLDVIPHNLGDEFKQMGLTEIVQRRFPFSVNGFGLGPVKLYNYLLGKEASDTKSQAPFNETIRQLGLPANRPRFLWLHSFTVHSPYASPAPFLGSFEPSPLARDGISSNPPSGFGADTDPGFPAIYEGRYDEAIRYLDDSLGRIFGWLKAQGRYDQTLIVFTADHGESFHHGYGKHGGPLLTEDLIRIPCLIKQPFQRKAERNLRLCEQADLAPTLLQMVGLPVPLEMEGRSMLVKPDGLPIFSMNHDYSGGPRSFVVAVRIGTWKYVEHFWSWGESWPKRELYDLEHDPGETHNIVSTQPERANKLQGMILKELNKRGMQTEG
ncbi:MAG: sulfatase [Holophaga sp.]|nr:sulfatase [Holophaga sp.]